MIFFDPKDELVTCISGEEGKGGVLSYFTFNKKDNSINCNNELNHEYLVYEVQLNFKT